MLMLGKCLALALLGNWQALQSFGREFKCLVVFFFLFLSFSIEFLNLSGVFLCLFSLSRKSFLYKSGTNQWALPWKSGESGIGTCKLGRQS